MVLEWKSLERQAGRRIGALRPKGRMARVRLRERAKTGQHVAVVSNQVVREEGVIKCR